MTEVPQAWTEELQRTWLGRPALVAEYDRWVRSSLVGHRFGDAARVGPEQGISPWSVETLASAIDRFAIGGEWIWATAAIANLAELLFCAEDGGIKTSKKVEQDSDLELLVRKLKTVRNICFHPAFQKSAGNDDPHMLGFIAMLRSDDAGASQELARRLAEDWSHFATRPATSFALRTLNAAGIEYAKRLKSSKCAFNTGDSERQLGQLTWRP